MHDALFAKQREWSGRSNAVAIFKEYAGAQDLDQAAFDECLDSGRTADQVQADLREGMTRGIRGTPSFFINGQLLVGAQPFSAFASVVDNALAGNSAGPPVAAGEASGADSAGSPAPDPELLVPTPVVFALTDGDDTLLTLGDPKAPVTIVEFTDYQCPFCSRYYQQTWPVLKEQYVDTGRVYYVFKDYPLSSIHPEAFKAHEAARCAADLGGDDSFWQMHGRLFEGQAQWASNPDHAAVFLEYASGLGLDEDAFKACLEGGDGAAAVQADVDEGRALGVTGTPTFFIAGYPFSGAQPIELFDQAITLAENGQLREAIAQAIARAQAERQAQEQPRPTIAPADVPIGDAPAKGDPNAPVTIVEYSDYQCSFCGRYFQETLPQLLENYVDTGQVRYVFKDFPLTSIHPQAVKAAEAARCAREVGEDETYWLMHDRLFERQGEWSGNSQHVALFKSYAGELGLDQAAFDACLDGGSQAAAVQADFQEGAGFGVTGTPAFFINGQPVSGAQPYQVFEQVIEALL
jgi:protein-disulfide isomerase